MDHANKSLDWTIPLTLSTAGLAGLIAGHLLGHRRRSAKAIQKLVTANLQGGGQLVGSWIQRQPIHYQATLAYQGGFRRHEGPAMVSYHFLANATTGALLEINRID